MPALRRLAAALGVAVIASMVFTTVGNAANFRYWGFFQQADSAWTMAAVGAAQAVPEHGAVDGWRYAVAGDSARAPRTDLTFDDICPDAEAADGSKVVAVVIDPGTAEDAPEGGEVPGAFAECAEVATDATSMDALTAATEVIDEGGFVCSIGGYPQSGCDPNEVPGDAPTDDESTVDVALPTTAEQAPGSEDGTEEPNDEATTESAEDDTTAAADESDDDGSGSIVAVIVAVAIVLILAITGVVRSRRQSAES